MVGASAVSFESRGSRVNYIPPTCEHVQKLSGYAASTGCA